MFFLILVLLTFARPVAAAEDTFTGVERVVAVGDVHGDYDAFVTILRSAGVIDKKNKWSGGKAHLVQLGDMIDRGPESRKSLDFLMALEKQAAKAGGQVHTLIGNHEAMNMYGDLRYTTPGDFAAFRTDDSPRIRDAFWEEQLKQLPEKPNDAAKKKWEDEHPLGWFEHRRAFSSQGAYGKWIRSHNAVIKINDVIYLHGGISPKYVSMTIAQINEAIVAELSDFTKIKDGDILTGEDGPLWYRGLAKEGNGAAPEFVDQLLAAYGVKHVVIGHTPTKGVVAPLFDGKVIQDDVGLSAYFGSGRACLVIEKDKLYAIDHGQQKLLGQ